MTATFPPHCFRNLFILSKSGKNFSDVVCMKNQTEECEKNFFHLSFLSHLNINSLLLSFLPHFNHLVKATTTTTTITVAAAILLPSPSASTSHSHSHSCSLSLSLSLSLCLSLSPSRFFHWSIRLLLLFLTDVRRSTPAIPRCTHMCIFFCVENEKIRVLPLSRSSSFSLTLTLSFSLFTSSI